MVMGWPLTSFSPATRSPEASTLPSAEKATEVTWPLCPVSVRTPRAATTSQSRTVLSRPPEATSLPSAEKAREATPPLWPLRAWRGCPEFGSQSWMVGPRPPLASRLPSGEKATARTGVSPSSRHSTFPAAGSHRSIAVPSAAATARALPRAPNASAVTSPFGPVSRRGSLARAGFDGGGEGAGFPDPPANARACRRRSAPSASRVGRRSRAPRAKGRLTRRWPLWGKLRGEAFYRGRPTSYWRPFVKVAEQFPNAHSLTVIGGSVIHTRRPPPPPPSAAEVLLERTVNLLRRPFVLPDKEDPVVVIVDLEGAPDPVAGPLLRQLATDPDPEVHGYAARVLWLLGTSPDTGEP